MAEQKTPDEPSMDEILSSIRRIIADEEGGENGKEAAGKGADSAKAGGGAKAGDEAAAEGKAATASGNAAGSKAQADNTDAAKGKQADSGKGAEEEDDDVLDLASLEDAAAKGRAKTARTDPDELEFDAMNDATATAPAAAPAQNRTAKPAANGDERLIGDQAATAASDSFGKLTRTLSPQEQPLPSTGKTIEEMVAEMIRPLLKDWVDNNLPPLVERIVEREIKKLVRHAETE